jgi:AmmeMemoRadiSam system protein B
MTRMRIPAAAGTFYPARRPDLSSMVDGLLAAADARARPAHRTAMLTAPTAGGGGVTASGAAPAPGGVASPGGVTSLGGAVPGGVASPGGVEGADAKAATTPDSTTAGGALVALVVPHAGYIYSGPIAASAYRLLRGSAHSRIALLGPAHFVPLRGFAVPRVDAWVTPLGDVAIDAELRAVAQASGARVDDAPHEPEHSLEVQLPFLQRVIFPVPAILPVAVGLTRPADVAALIERLARSAFVVVSTDLSHYHDVETARRLDRRTADAIVARDPDALGADDACGIHALRGIVELAREQDLEVELLDLRSSADTAGDPWRVVGYGALAFRRPAAARPDAAAAR